MPDKFLGVVAFHKGQRKVAYVNVFVFFQLDVLAGVAVDFVKILDRHIFIRAFVFQQVLFFEAIQLELDEYRGVLEFHYDYQLTTGPQRIDVVIIKNTADVPIKKNIAAIFRKVNLVEYKSPDNNISVKDFYKVYGYACQYIQ